ncbi:MAG TPA: CoA pyrophosphatase [Acidimicrobiales bacterium]|nr:CoA pyrophosphatase [Acidimicrobiales bacterium]
MEYEWLRNLQSFERVAVTPRPDQRHSAVVLCVVVDGHDEDCLVITRRASKLRNHAGQYALPGGRIDDGETAVAAALREMHEEVGLESSEADVVGVLDDYVTRSGFVITPVVVAGPPSVTLVANPDEVAEIYLVPIRDLDHPDAPRLLTIEESDQPVIQMPMRGGWIHAPTAAVLYQFNEVVVHGRTTRVAHFEQPTWAWK